MSRHDHGSFYNKAVQVRARNGRARGFVWVIAGELELRRVHHLRHGIAPQPWRDR
jgi:hypothetical protein